MNNRGQGTIEYLVIIAIVVVIALVVVGLLLQIMGNFGGMSESAARAAWKSGTPLAISDYAQNDTVLTLVLQNTSGTTITFNSVSVDGGTSDLNSTVKTLQAGETYVITGTVATCATGTKFSYTKSNIDINYSTVNIDNLRQSGAADITGTCS